MNRDASTTTLERLGDVLTVCNGNAALYGYRYRVAFCRVCDPAQAHLIVGFVGHPFWVAFDVTHGLPFVDRGVIVE